MALVLNEEQLMLRDSAHDFLQARAPISHLRELRDSGNADGFSRELWSEITEMGWAAILVPEEHGGLGYGHTGIGIVLQECGKTLTPSPLLGSAMIGVAALNRTGGSEQCQSILPALAAGEHLMALAVDESAQHRPDVCGCKVEKTPEGFKLTGRKMTVLDGQVADTLIVSATSGDKGEISLFLVPSGAAGVEIEPVALLDTHHAAHVRFDGVTLKRSALLGDLDDGSRHLDYILDVARIGQSAELLGIAEEAFARTIEYLKDRKQFGVPIGSFQGLQHRAAIMFGEIEMCKSAVLNALGALDDGRDNIAEIASMTKAKLCETAHTVAAEAIQMHGGIGMTDDFDIGFFLKRCQILESVYGDRYYQLDRFATLRGY